MHRGRWTSNQNISIIPGSIVEKEGFSNDCVVKAARIWRFGGSEGPSKRASYKTLFVDSDSRQEFEQTNEKAESNGCRHARQCPPIMAPDLFIRPLPLPAVSSIRRPACHASVVIQLRGYQETNSNTPSRNAETERRSTTVSRSRCSRCLLSVRPVPFAHHAVA
jgi:hypothetical protein